MKIINNTLIFYLTNFIKQQSNFTIIYNSMVYTSFVRNENLIWDSLIEHGTEDKLR